MCEQNESRFLCFAITYIRFLSYQRMTKSTIAGLWFLLENTKSLITSDYILRQSFLKSSIDGHTKTTSTNGMEIYFLHWSSCSGCEWMTSIANSITSSYLTTRKKRQSSNTRTRIDIDVYIWLLKVLLRELFLQFQGIIYCIFLIIKEKFKRI